MAPRADQCLVSITGDLGEVDTHGYSNVHARRVDLIITAADAIPPRSEKTLERFPESPGGRVRSCRIDTGDRPLPPCRRTRATSPTADSSNIRVQRSPSDKSPATSATCPASATTRASFDSSACRYVARSCGRLHRRGTGYSASQSRKSPKLSLGRYVHSQVAA